MRRALKAILFDFDGVIVDSESLHHRAYDLALAPLGIAPIPFDVYSRHWSNGFWRDYATKAYPGVDLDDLKQRKEKLFLELLEGEAKMIPGAAAAVERLAGRWPLALATGSLRAAARMVLERFGLLKRFRAVITREDYTAEKPAPDAFLAACAKMGAAGRECVAVEDSLKGLRAARGAGIACIVAPNRYTAGADFSAAAALLETLDELTVTRVEEAFADEHAGG